MTTDTLYETFLSPFKLNLQLDLSNRIVMAPMTRCKALRNLVHNSIMADYYARRANAGLIITEATIISENGQGYPNTQGIFNEAQVEGWKYITDTVHQAGGKLFLQLWHVGRVSHPMYLNGEKPIAPSAIGINGRVSYTNLAYETPRALALNEIPQYVELFMKGAANAVKAGFDGVEIHGANGYLIDQFLHRDTNQRTDGYGGSPENRARFLLEIVQAITQTIGSKKTGVRLSPAAYVHDIKSHPDDVATFIYTLKQLEHFAVAYVHTAIADDETSIDYLNGTVSAFVRANYKGTLIANGGYTAHSATKKVAIREADLISFARPFLANADLINKLKNNEELKNYYVSILKGDLL